MADFSISDFKSKLSVGARANLFRVSIDGFSGVTNLSDVTLQCKSAAVPAYSIGVIEVPFRGRRVKVPGDRTFADWTITVINDPEQNIRAFFDDWMKYINDNNFTTSKMRESSGDYTSTINVEHLNGSGSVSRRYTLENAFPNDVSAIDLSYDSSDTLEEFTVTFQYTHSKFTDGI
jgi:hypothetical protein